MYLNCGGCEPGEPIRTLASSCFTAVAMMPEAYTEQRYVFTVGCEPSEFELTLLHSSDHDDTYTHRTEVRRM